MAKVSNKITGHLREDCVREARSIIATEGIDKLSLREVARRLNVSHQAPYKHYPSREHLIAEVLKNAYQHFAEYLDARVRNKTDADLYLRKMGEAYIRYAVSHPLEYQLMFSTSLPTSSDHPDMLNQAHHAFDMLRGALKMRAAAANRLLSEKDIDHQALFVWSTLHGLVSILRSEIVGKLNVKRSQSAIADVLSKIGPALDGK